MISQNYAYAEVLDILQYMDEKYISQIPKKFLEMIKDNADINYTNHINPNRNLQEQNLSKDALSILAIINLKYWVKDEKHRKVLLRKYKNNGENIHKNSTENIKLNSLFDTSTEKNEEIAIIKRDNFFIKLKNILKNILRKER